VKKDLPGFLTALQAHPDLYGRGCTWTVHQRMALYGVSAVSVAVICEGAILEEFTTGTIAANDPIEIDEHTLFNSCSISKAITALGVLRLIASGKIDLDAEVNEIISCWKLLNEDGRPATTTVRQLLSHTGGVNVHGATGYAPDGDVPTLIGILNGFSPSLTPKVICAPQGPKHYEYSSGGFGVLQLVVSEATQLAFPDAMDLLVFKPLDLSDSCYSVGPPTRPHVQAHVSLLRQASPETNLQFPEMAAAGLWTTAGDLCRITLAVQSSLKTDSFLPRQLAEECVTTQADNRDVGLGYHLAGERCARQFCHTGGHLGWRAETCGWVNEPSGYAVLVNNGYSGSEIIWEIVNAIRDRFGFPAS
jgi:CubicO group peptidase (beta-lactamase class C family)